MDALRVFSWAVVAGWGLAGCHSSELTPVKDPAQWGKQEVLVTRGDLAVLCSNVIESELVGASASPLAGAIEGAHVTLVDGAGKLRIELIVGRQAMSSLRLKSPGDQVQALLELKKQVVSRAEQALTPGRSLFTASGSGTAPSEQQSPLRQLLGSVAGSGGVVVVGFEHDAQLHVYATVAGEQVDFNQDAPDGRLRLRGWE